MNSFITFLIAHWDLTAATLLIVALIIFFEIREHAPGISHLSTQEALHMMNRENALVLDVRDEKLFSEGHILKAHNIPFACLEKEISHFEKNKEHPVILVCNAGNRSVQAAKLLHHHHFKKVFSLKGGMGAWRLSNLPITK
ncbi:MAG: rhodanese-like protein [uncultured bacterium]|nr:MAG: rhodanese-like protein [uncultured bacterium]OGT15721.1 MAG: hypothetical protein A3B69_01285 [Gammaproteobacteria bacterium RIFCSPHIGHO2_02_FULL_38_33]OGT23669.1 MAG: hypothetical protein A2W47_05920 [Gammaproteobacteria bacterium RIFCSPHIGHO2_12_38_15]OGT68758.1 MAG: hypothetical protein A3I12_06210 [Gammaproteobacteria bacterium RIFCSPLOWO2_02_FULL_38_11]OGT78056.1 MAG: hypothetical protein A3G71_00730 [Gammaproteobacteria bacterium RIFCSPLOWO2_12_FULL_38_14]